MSSKTPRDSSPVPDPSGDSDDCDLKIDHDLEGIDQAVLLSVGKGQVLTVALEGEGDYKSVVCKSPEGAVVGALSAFRGIGNLVRCIERGRRYEVSITEIGPGHCHVQGGLVQT